MEKIQLNFNINQLSNLMDMKNYLFNENQLKDTLNDQIIELNDDPYSQSKKKKRIRREN